MATPVDVLEYVKDLHAAPHAALTIRKQLKDADAHVKPDTVQSGRRGAWVDGGGGGVRTAVKGAGVMKTDGQVWGAWRAWRMRHSSCS